ncbi:MAG: dUTP diphosphatase [Planctomycetota bacterium]
MNDNLDPSTLSAAPPPPIACQVLAHGQGLEPPTYATVGAAGMDVRAAVTETLTIRPGERALVPTGLALAIPPGYEIQVRPRSGLAARHGITVANAPGTIDSDYRGEVQVILINLGDEPYRIERGERIAQLVAAPVLRMPLQIVDRLDATERMHGGFGSTGRQ